MRHRAAAFGGAEVRGGDENGPISRRKLPSNGGPECRYDASLAAKHEIQASLISYWKNIFEVPVPPKSTLRLLADGSKGTRGQPGYRSHRLAASMRRACSPGIHMGSRAASNSIVYTM